MKRKLTRLSFVINWSIQKSSWRWAPQIDCTVDLQLQKSTAITEAVFGDLITYTIHFTNAGSIDAENVVITDPIPTDTTYDVSSITLDGSPLTDSSADTDAGFISANVVTVNLGDLNDSDTHTITFNVIIN